MSRFTFLAMLWVACPAAAIAQSPTATVIVSPADFVSKQTRADLDRRVHDAIEQVCGSYATIESWQLDETKACWRSARKQVANKLPEIRTKTTAEFDPR